MANEFVTRTGLIVSGSTYLPAATSASKGYILSFDTSTKEVYYMSTSSVTVTVPGSDTQVIYNNGGSFGASSNFVFSGSNVGIGVTNPTYKLHVSSSNNNDGIAVHYPATNSTQFPFYVGDNSNGVYARLNATEFEFKRNGNGSTIKTVGSSNNLVLESATNLVFNANGATTQMYVSSSGNVGIGTTSPTSKLFVAGTTGNIITVSGSDSGDGIFLDERLFIAFGDTGTTTNRFRGISGGFVFQDNAYSTFGQIGSSNTYFTSNVGIGTTSPSSLLHVSGTTPTVTIEGSSTNSAKIDLVGPYTTWTLENQYINGATNDMFRIYNSQLGANAITINRLSNNVGIGTTSPSQKLEVSGSGYIIKASATGSDSSYFQAVNGSYDYIAGIATSLGYGLMGMNSNHALAIMTSGSERMRISSAGNVGIGTTSPAKTLDVYSSAGTNTAQIVASDAGSTNRLYLGTFSNTGYISFGGTYQNGWIANGTNAIANIGFSATSGDSNIQFYTSTSNGAGPTERMRITNAGNVGIGTNIPQNNLHISGSANGTDAGNIRIDSTDQYGGLVINENTTFRTFLGYGNAGNIFSNAQSDSTALRAANYLHLGASSVATLTINGSNDYVGIGTTSPNAKLDVNGNVIVTGSLTVSGSSTFTNIGPAVFTGSITQNASTASFGGVVGIGTTTPAYKLDVVGTGKFSGDINLGSSGEHYLQNDASTTFIGLNFDSPYIRFAVNNTERMRITSAGDVGIGTSSPNSTFQVSKGGVTFQVTDTNKTASNSFSVYGYSQTSWAIATGNSGSFSGGEKIIITDSGNVGIGETSPSFKLVVTDANNYQGILINGNNAPVIAFDRSTGQTAEWKVGISGNNGESFSVSSGTANTDRFFISSSGNVGINTTTPSATLEVGGNIKATSFTGSFSGSVSAPGSTTQIVYNSGGALAADSGLVYSGSRVGVGTTSPNRTLTVNGTFSVASGDTNVPELVLSADGTATYISSTYKGTSSYVPLWLETNGSPRVAITTTGNVGIGTTSPATTLQVNGTARATRLNSTGGIIDFDAQTGNNFIQISSGEVSIANSGNVNMTITAAGNVGIGTTTPTDSKLEVNGNIGYTGDTDRYFFFPDVYQGTGSLTLQAGFGSALAGGAIAIYGHNTPTNSGSVAVGLSNVGDFKVQNYLGDSTKFIVKSSGNVGIGTTAPTAKFGVKLATATSVSTIANSTGWDSTYAVFGNPESGTSQGYAIGIRNSLDGINILSVNPMSDWVDTNHYSRNHIFYGGETERFRITNAGNVGIGVTAPTYNLEVSGSGYISGSLTVAGTITAQKLNVQQITSSVVYSSGSNIFGNSLSNTQTFTGSVLITGSIALSGSISSTGTALINSSLYLDSNEVWSQNGGDLFVKADNKVYIQPAASTTAVFDTNGNVGIGTTSPLGQLDIRTTSGDTIFRSVVANGGTATSNDLSIKQDFITGVAANYLWSNSSYILGIGRNGGTMPTTEAEATALSTFVINSSGNVGIGTTNPSQKLDISAGTNLNLGVSQLSLDNFSNEGIGITFSRTSSDDDLSAIGIIDSDKLGLFSRSGIIFATSGSSTYSATSEKMRIAENGNVGIGTDSPSSMLTLNGTTPYIRLERGGAPTWEIRQNYPSTEYGFQVVNVTNSNIPFFIGESSNVGIGTTSPSSKLDVRGVLTVSGSGANVDIKSTTTTSTLNIYGSDTSTNFLGQGILSDNVTRWRVGMIADRKYVIQPADGSGNFTTTPAITVLSGSGNVGIGTTSPEFPLDVNGSIKLATTLLFSGTNYYPRIARSTNDLQFSTDNAGSADVRLAITAAGNVGIGTTSPTEKLHVAGNIVLGSTANGYQEAGSKYIGLSYPSLGTDGYVGFQFESVNAPAPYNGNYSQNIKFYTHHYAASTGGTPRMTIQYDGNVGIGTANPTEKLHVIGNTIIQATSTGNGTTAVRVNNSAGTQVLAIGAAGEIIMNNSSKISTIVDPTSTQPQLELYNAGTGYTTLQSSTSYGLLLNPNGSNVGIGTTSPSQVLEVQGQAQIGNDSVTSAGLFIARKNSNQSKSHYFLSAQESPTYQWIEGGYFTSELAGVSVANNSGKPYYEAYSPAGQYKAFGFINQTTSGSSFTSTAVTASMVLYQGGNIALAPTQGNVGIGTYSPTGKLHVLTPSADGAPGLIVSSSGWGAIGTPMVIFDGGPSGDGDILKVKGLGGRTDAKLFQVEGSSGSAVLVRGDGRVGIGTTSPDRSLLVSGSIGAFVADGQGTVSITVGEGSNVSGNIISLETNATSNTTRLYNNGTGTDFNIGSTGTGASVSLSSVKDISLKVNNGADVFAGTTALFITGSTGNVGIGTTSPRQKLDVSGNARLYSALLQQSGINLQDSDITTSNEYINHNGPILTDGSPNSISSYGTFRGYQAVYGTSSAYPEYQVTAQGAYSNPLFEFYSGAGGSQTLPTNSAIRNGFLYQFVKGPSFNGNGSKSPVTSSNSTLVWGITSANNAYFAESVGIGTTSPASIGTGITSLDIQGSNAGGIAFGPSGTKNYIYGASTMYVEANTTAVFVTSGSEKMRITSVGNVGIGTTSPSYKLHVSGAIAVENQGTTTIESTTFSGSLTGNTNIAFVPTASFKAAFFDYYVASGSVNMRAGTVMAVHNNSTSRYTDTSTADIGTTAAVDFSTSIVAGSLVLTANISSGTWEVKTAYRAL